MIVVRRKHYLGLAIKPTLGPQEKGTLVHSHVLSFGLTLPKSGDLTSMQSSTFQEQKSLKDRHQRSLSIVWTLITFFFLYNELWLGASQAAFLKQIRKYHSAKSRYRWLTELHEGKNCGWLPFYPKAANSQHTQSLSWYLDHSWQSISN